MRFFEIIALLDVSFLFGITITNLVGVAAPRGNRPLLEALGIDVREDRLKKKRKL
jgi:hypothetical protein